MNSQNLENLNHETLIENIRNLLDESEEQSRRMMMLTNVSIEIHHATNLDELLKVLSKRGKHLIPCKHVSLLLADSYGIWQTYIVYEETKETTDDLDYKNVILSKTISTLSSQILHDDDRLLPQFQSKLVIPIHYDRYIVGTMQFARNQPFDDEDLRLGLLLSYQLSAGINKFNQIQIMLETQSQLSDYAAELVNHNEDIEAYNHTIAHDLKSPLSIIPLKVSMIEMTEKSLTESTNKLLEDIRYQVTYVSNIIDQLLVLSTLSNSNMTMSRLDVNQIIDTCLKRFAEIETGEVKVKVQPDLPKVLGYGQWLEEVFANLIANAIKYRGEDNPDPQITISSSLAEGKVIFSVSDNGIGIPSKDQTHIFKMFNRVREIEAEGLGLGLAIVHRIVKKLGGEIGLESKAGKGTRFWFTIPSLNA